MVSALIGVVKWTALVVLGALVVVPALVVALVVWFWSRQRPMDVSEEAPVPYIQPRIGHPTVVSGG